MSMEDFNRRLNSMPLNVSYSFSMPYPGWPKEQSDQTTQKEMEIIVSADEMVDKMLTYPEAEAIINKIRKGNK
jgi:hypothetical protein